MKFALIEIKWFNNNMKNLISIITDKASSKYQKENSKKNHVNTSDINVLLNRIHLKKKDETRKKLYFSAAASTGLILFGLIIF